MGLDPYTGTRGDLTCQLFGSQMASASCLAFDPLWYSGFEVQPASTFFTISISLSKLVDGKPILQETLSLGPQTMLSRSVSGAVIARLQGDLVSYRQQVNIFIDLRDDR